MRLVCFLLGAAVILAAALPAVKAYGQAGGGKKEAKQKKKTAKKKTKRKPKKK